MAPLRAGHFCQEGIEDVIEIRVVSGCQLIGAGGEVIVKHSLVKRRWEFEVELIAELVQNRVEGLWDAVYRIANRCIQLFLYAGLKYIDDVGNNGSDGVGAIVQVYNDINARRTVLQCNRRHALGRGSDAEKSCS